MGAYIMIGIWSDFFIDDFWVILYMIICIEKYIFRTLYFMCGLIFHFIYSTITSMTYAM